ncbi:nucleoside deaminase [Mesorhizobium sp. B2-6-5]|nr:nucleoside deaminase [Mesorhizobium sp. B2-6-5]
MRRSIELSREALSEPGCKPFGAVVVKGGKIIGEGFNRAVVNFDPTSHGEVEAIRDACRHQGSIDLSGCDLYTSCEPCPLCVSAMRMAGISRVFYAASIESATRAIPDLTERCLSIRYDAARPVIEGSTLAAQLLADEADAVLADWMASRLP